MIQLTQAPAAHLSLTPYPLITPKSTMKKPKKPRALQQRHQLVTRGNNVKKSTVTMGTSPESCCMSV